MTDTVKLIYPGNPALIQGEITEDVRVRPTSVPDQFEVASHAFLMPLGPGDIVRVNDENTVREVVRLSPQFIFHVDLHHPADYFAGPLPDAHPAKKIAADLFAEWRRDAYVTEMTDFVIAVSSQSETWVNDKVRSSKYVEALTCTRTPEVRSVAIEAQPVL